MRRVKSNAPYDCENVRFFNKVVGLGIKTVGGGVVGTLSKPKVNENFYLFTFNNDLSRGAYFYELSLPPPTTEGDIIFEKSKLLMSNF